MNQVFTDIPLTFMSPGDALKYWEGGGEIAASLPKLRDTIYELMVVMKPHLHPRGLIKTFPVAEGAVTVGRKCYPLTEASGTSRVSFLVSTLNEEAAAFIADLAVQDAHLAAAAEAIAWQAAEQALYFLFESLLSAALEKNMAIRKSSPWPEDFLSRHEAELMRALQTVEIGLTQPGAEKTFWGIVTWFPL
jgi:hypothetical protein